MSQFRDSPFESPYRASPFDEGGAPPAPTAWEITAISVEVLGVFGYSVNDTFEVDTPGGGPNATGIVTAVSGDSATAVALLTGGSYSVDPNGLSAGTINIVGSGFGLGVRVDATSPL